MAGFKKVTRPTAAPATPEALLRDLSGKKIKAPFAHQADVWRAYISTALDWKDVAIQLPTGSGKTLVGLVLAEWRRRMFTERVVYLCLTKQLVNQVVKQARESYGIHAHAFIGPKDDFSPPAAGEYNSATAIAVTTYSALFNVNPFFSDAGAIICDDVHAADGYIAGPWTLDVNRQKNPALFGAIRDAIAGAISPEDMERLLADTPPADYGWVGKVHTPSLVECSAAVRSAVDATIGDGREKYAWRFIRDKLHACHVYYSHDAFCIRPYIPPTRHHAPFDTPRQRIYMSATLGASGDLERFTGRCPIRKIPAPEGWDSHGTGRRLFFFPTRSLEREESIKVALNMANRAGRSLVLVPDGRRAKAWRELIGDQMPGATVLSAQEIEESKAAFTGEAKAVAVVANRYDGIDFPEDDCRFTILSGLPDAVNLQEEFLRTRLAGGPLLRDRITTRLLQGFGRCTRSPTDYAAIVILSDRLSNYLQRPDTRRHLHPELQAELEFAIQQSDSVTAEHFADLFELMLAQGEDWAGADEQIRSLRADLPAEPVPGAAELSIAAESEIEYQYALWEKRFVDAAEAAAAAAAAATSPVLRSHRAWWLYCAGAAAYLATFHNQAKLRAKAVEHFKAAQKAVPILFPWLAKLSSTSEERVTRDDSSLEAAKALGRFFIDLGTPLQRKLDAYIASIRQGLHGSSAKAFERAHADLARLLGFEGKRPDEAEQAAPDVWWNCPGKLCLVFEDHSDAFDSTPLSPEKARQVAGHCKWLRAKASLGDDVQVISILITPCNKAQKGTLPQLDGVSVWRLRDFYAFAEGVLSLALELRTTFSGETDLEWLAGAAETIEAREWHAGGLKKTLPTWTAGRALTE